MVIGFVMKKIFDSYLLSQNQFHDFDEMAVAAASAWDQRYRKIGNGPEYLNDPAIQDSVVDEMLDTVFLNSRMPTNQPLPRQRHQMARNAAQYLKDNIGEEISLRAMCEYSGVSERSLRQGFLECFGVTPSAFVRRARLFRLRDTLKDPANEHSTITANALQLGVAHLGRLS
jgi:AraC family ethanolamine operon transcriptional activator